MNGLSNLTELLHQFQSPVRVLLPKILKSRDDWREKCQMRRAQNNTLTIKIRDLTARREAWRSKRDAVLADRQKLRTEHDPLRTEHDPLQRQLADRKKM